MGTLTCCFPFPFGAVVIETNSLQLIITVLHLFQVVQNHSSEIPNVILEFLEAAAQATKTTTGEPLSFLSCSLGTFWNHFWWPPSFRTEDWPPWGHCAGAAACSSFSSPVTLTWLVWKAPRRALYPLLFVPMLLYCTHYNNKHFWREKTKLLCLRPVQNLKVTLKRVHQILIWCYLFTLSITKFWFLNVIFTLEMQKAKVLKKSSFRLKPDFWWKNGTI